MRADRSEIEKTILSLTTARGEGRSICPSEVARAIAGNDEKVWRLLMHPVRETALALAREGRIVILRKGKPVPADEPVRGVIRLAVPPPLETLSSS